MIVPNAILINPGISLDLGNGARWLRFAGHAWNPPLSGILSNLLKLTDASIAIRSLRQGRDLGYVPGARIRLVGRGLAGKGLIR